MGIYRYTGSAQYVTVAATGEYDVVAFGAQGGYSSAGPFTGGLGAEIGGDLELQKGEKLEIVVGGSGGGNYSGGGGSFVLGNFDGLYVPLVIAGGGGGASNGANGGAGQTTLASLVGTSIGYGGPSNGGAGGSGVKSDGQDVLGPGFPGGGRNLTGNYAGGAAPNVPGQFTSEEFQGGFGGGGAGDIAGGGGGGGYSGGAGGQGSAHFAAQGGGSFDIGAPVASETLAGSSASAGLVIIASVCFASDTLVRTLQGDVAVESLRVGDFVLNASGAKRPIKWLGHRTIDCRNHPRPHEVMPIRISAHAFGENRPARDLFLSPGHPVLVAAAEAGQGGHLVPIMCLINGTTIERAPVDEITYWHVELDQHDILLAEGLPAESYIDLGSRPWFDGADGALYDPDLAAPGMPGRCRPVAIDGPVVEAERRRLDMVFAMRLTAACAWPDECSADWPASLG